MRISDWRSDVCASDLLSTPTRCCADRARDLVPERGLHDTPRLGGGLALGEGVDMLHAFAHLAPDGVLAVEKACVVEANEKLAVGERRTDVLGKCGSVPVDLHGPRNLQTKKQTP